MATELKLDPELQLMLDRMPPFTVSIEPVNRPVYQYGYHLGHDEVLARNFVRGMWRDYDAHHGQGLYTIALMRDGKIHDVFDGREWFSDSMNAFWDQAAADHRAELSNGVRIQRAFKPINTRPGGIAKSETHDFIINRTTGDVLHPDDLKVVDNWEIQDEF
jgi:hypothetical protein